MNAWLLRSLVAVGLLLSLTACEEEKDDIRFTREGEALHSSYERIDQLYPDFFNANLLLDRDSMDADADRVCAYRLTGTTGFPGLYLDCWGSKTPSGSLVRDKEPQANGLTLGSGHVCVSKTSHDGTGIYCEGENDHGQSENPKIGSLVDSGHYTVQPKFLSSGDTHNCVIDQQGIYCWGNNDQGQLDAPTVIDPLFIASAQNHNCAIDSATAVHCWGDNSAGQTQVPTDLVNAYYLALGKDFSCALHGVTDDARGITCWGNTQWTTLAPTELADWDFINAGDDHACAVKLAQDENSVTCWGNNAHGQLDVPLAAQAQVHNLVSGNGFSCASVEYLGYPAGVNSRNEDTATNDVLHLGVTCWGRNNEGQTEPPAFLCLGYHNSAVLTEDRSCP